MKFTVDMIEELIQRPLSESETKTIEWLSGWEEETQKNIYKILTDYGAATYKAAKDGEYEGSARQVRDRALLIIGAFIKGRKETKSAIALLDGDLDALSKFWRG